MDQQKNKAGYILVLTLLLTSLMVMLVTYLANRGTVYTPLAKTMLDREKAKALAFGGLQLGISQLAHYEKPKEKAPANHEELYLLKTVMPHLNQWQKIELKEKTDGVDAQIQVCVGSEEGKININQLYNFETQKFLHEGDKQKDSKKVLQKLFTKIEKQIGSNNLFQGFEKFLKARQYKLNDVTELLTIKEFERFSPYIFYEPSAKKDQQKQPIYLTDIFTVHSPSSTIEPWLLSNSLTRLLELKNVNSDDQESKKRMVEHITKKFKPAMKLSEDWKTVFTPMYGKDIKSLPQGFEFLLNQKFGPTIFSVLSYAVVDKVSQRIFAIVERKKSSQGKDIVYDVAIKKLYWL